MPKRARIDIHHLPSLSQQGIQKVGGAAPARQEAPLEGSRRRGISASGKGLWPASSMSVCVNMRGGQLTCASYRSSMNDAAMHVHTTMRYCWSSCREGRRNAAQSGSSSVQGSTSELCMHTTHCTSLCCRKSVLPPTKYTLHACMLYLTQFGKISCSLLSMSFLSIYRGRHMALHWRIIVCSSWDGGGARRGWQATGGLSCGEWRMHQPLPPGACGRTRRM